MEFLIWTKKTLKKLNSFSRLPHRLSGSGGIENLAASPQKPTLAQFPHRTNGNLQYTETLYCLNKTRTTIRVKSKGWVLFSGSYFLKKVQILLNIFLFFFFLAIEKY